MKKDLKITLVLISIMLGIKIFDTLLSPNHIFPGRIAVFPVTEIALVAVLGLIGTLIARKLEFPTVCNAEVSIKNKFVIPYLVGLGLGVFFAATDSIFNIGDISVGWPLSMIFYVWGAISQEVITHFFPTALLVWFFSVVVFKRKYANQVYWATALLLSLIAAIGMASSFYNPEIPLQIRFKFVPYVIGGLVFITEFVILKMLKTYGLLSALSTRLGFYTIWHILWPVVFYI